MSEFLESNINAALCLDGLKSCNHAKAVHLYIELISDDIENFKGRKKYQSVAHESSFRMLYCLLISDAILLILTGADPGFLPGEGAKGMMTLYGMGISDF